HVSGGYAHQTKPITSYAGGAYKYHSKPATISTYEYNSKPASVVSTSVGHVGVSQPVVSEAEYKHHTATSVVANKPTVVNAGRSYGSTGSSYTASEKQVY